jgi:palmitoyltransferase
LVFLWLSTTTTSNVTPANHRAAMLAYPYDFALFHPGYFCRTCRHAKPARSKHCPICRACVQKQDHHCVWINNCVGRNNYVWFCLLLVSIAGLLAYGTVTGHRLLDARLQDRFVPPALTRGSRTGKRWSTRLGWAEYVHCWAWAVSVEWPIGAVTLLATMSFPLALGFLTYHLYLCWAGMTTNESAKWSDWKEDIADGLVFRARISDLRTTYPPLPPDVEPPDAAVHWPAGVRAKYWLVRMNEPGRRPTIQTEGVVDGRGDGEARPEDPTTPESPGRSVPDQRPDPRWTPVTTLAEVENVYDLGFGANLVDSLFNRG